jgi:NADH dehydrogenase (ubiquinone) 1 alpha subcomplex subunit 9
LGLLPFDPRDRQSIHQAIANADVVVNLIGKDYETKHIVATNRGPAANNKPSNINYTFQEVHVDIPQRLAEVAKAAGVTKFIHVSAASASIHSQSEWSRTKAAGEIAVRNILPDAIIVRPNTVFGPEDRFLNRIAEAIKRLPAFPLINEGANLLQPVYVGDVAKGLHKLIRVSYYDC